MKTKEVTGQTTDQKVDVYQMVTDRIIEALNEGTVPWRKSWTGFGLAKNFITKRSYSGINAILTNLSPYPIPYFLTFKQAKELGGSIKKGSKSIPIVFWRVSYKDSKGRYYPEHEVSSDTDMQKIFLLRYYRVFNVADVEGIEVPQPPVSHDHNFVPQCEQIIDHIPNPPVITKGSSDAYYLPGTDEVCVPSINQFGEPEMYYSTLFHELIHSCLFHNS